MSEVEKMLVTMGRLFKEISGLEQAIKDQKPEVIALYMGKVINSYQNIDKAFVEDCKAILTSKLS